jgi:hypothetical protein
VLLKVERRGEYFLPAGACKSVRQHSDKISMRSYGCFVKLCSVLKVNGFF